MTEQVVYGGQEVIGAARVEGPIVVIEGVDGVGYDEVAEVIDSQGRVRRGRVLEVGEGLAAQTQVDAPKLELAHEVRGAPIAVGQALVTEHLRQRLNVLRLERRARDCPQFPQRLERAERHTVGTI